MSVSKRIFDKDVYLYKIENKQGAFVEVLSYGGIIHSINVPDKNGSLTDVVLGFDTLQEYIDKKSSYIGATVGRYANRIKNATVNISGVEYALAKNNGNNHLHGGNVGFSDVLWSENTLTNDSVTLHAFFEDGFEKYPGNMNVYVTFKFDDSNTLTITYEADSDKDTLFNPTNHSYFNLDGHANGYVGLNKLKIAALMYNSIDSESIPTGICKAEGVMDFTSFKNFEDGFCDKDNKDIQYAKGYDHNYILENYSGKIEYAATMIGERSGIYMNVYTDMPGLQLYTSNFLKGPVNGKNGAKYYRRSAACLETQYYPDSVHHESWPSCMIKANSKVTHITKYAFTTVK